MPKRLEIGVNVVSSSTITPEITKQFHQDMSSFPVMRCYLSLLLWFVYLISYHDESSLLFSRRRKNGHWT
jgi:hypothetical protein